MARTVAELVLMCNACIVVFFAITQHSGKQLLTQSAVFASQDSACGGWQAALTLLRIWEDIGLRSGECAGWC
jgi:hypothetical protein